LSSYERDETSARSRAGSLAGRGCGGHQEVRQPPIIRRTCAWLWCVRVL